MIVTKDEALYNRARAYHDHGHEYNSNNISRGEEKALLTGFNYRMTELHATIGLVQLSKLDYILERHRENKKKLKEILSDFRFPFRRLSDEDGELADVLIFFLESPEQAIRFATKMKKSGLGTKNLPDAIRWHFSKHWKHMFDEYNFYPDSGKLWKKFRVSLSVLLQFQSLLI